MIVTIMQTHTKRQAHGGGRCYGRRLGKRGKRRARRGKTGERMLRSSGGCTDGEAEGDGGMGGRGNVGL